MDPFFDFVTMATLPKEVGALILVGFLVVCGLIAAAFFLPESKPKTYYSAPPKVQKPETITEKAGEFIGNKSKNFGKGFIKGLLD